MLVQRRLRMIMEPGTVVGPNLDGEYLKAHRVEDGWTHFRFATTADIEAVRDPDHSPRSVAEVRLRQGE
jgi:hypothetical protein